MLTNKNYEYRFEITRAVVLLLLIIPLPISSQTFILDSAFVLGEFENTIVWIENNSMSDSNGYFICNSPASHYEIEIGYGELSPNEFLNIPEDAFYRLTAPLWNCNILIDQTQTHFYSSPDTDFGGAVATPLFEEIPGTVKWFATSVNDSSVIFNYGWLYANAWYAEALLDMYSVTQDADLLDAAEHSLLATIPYLDASGQWLRETAVDESPIYIGMSQAILMRVLYKYSLVGSHSLLIGSLSWMSGAYEHTTEGVYNHWCNSRIGGIIRDIVLDVEETDYDVLQTELDLLYSRIVEFNGKIPYVMNEDHPSYPDFRPTYQTYDTFLLTLLSSISEYDLGFAPYYPLAFEESWNANYAKQFANNTVSAFLGLRTFGYLYDEFMSNQQTSEFLDSAPTSFRNGLAKLTALTALMQYGDSLVDTRPPIKAPKYFLRLAPNPFNNSQLISWYMPSSGQFKMTVTALDGRIVDVVDSGYLERGDHSLLWTPEINLSSGVYLIVVETPSGLGVRKTVLVQ